jgi:hypothetical protein
MRLAREHAKITQNSCKGTQRVAAADTQACSPRKRRRANAAHAAQADTWWRNAAHREAVAALLTGQLDPRRLALTLGRVGGYYSAESTLPLDLASLPPDLQYASGSSKKCLDRASVARLLCLRLSLRFMPASGFISRLRSCCVPVGAARPTRVVRSRPESASLLASHLSFSTHTIYLFSLTTTVLSCTLNVRMPARLDHVPTSASRPGVTV